MRQMFFLVVLVCALWSPSALAQTTSPGVTGVAFTVVAVPDGSAISL